MQGVTSKLEEVFDVIKDNNVFLVDLQSQLDGGDAIHTSHSQ